MPPAVPNVPLSNGVSMPQLGFGVWQVPNEQAPQVVATALEAGYRSIDTAALYGNEAGVGAAVAQSGLSRDEVFVTSKVWNSAQGYDSTLRAFDATMAELDLDVLDLYLVHWPAPKQDRYFQTWKAMEQLQADGRVRAIGVSNFSVAHLDRLAAETSTVPMVNQIELHPRPPNCGCATTTPSTGSSPRRGARSARARCSPIGSSAASRRRTTAHPRRSCSAGTSSRRWWPSRSP